MKEIIISPPEPNFITLEDAEIHKRNFYGVLIKGERAFIAKDSLFEGPHLPYRLKVAKDITSGNSFGYVESNLRKMVTEILSKGHKVFQFDSAKELYLWLAEEN